MQWQEIPTASLAAKRTTAPAAWQAPSPQMPPSRRSGVRETGSRPSADHPWHHVVEAYETGKQLTAARRAWLAVQP
jgi:hypothetical protein